MPPGSCQALRAAGEEGRQPLLRSRAWYPRSRAWYPRRYRAAQNAVPRPCCPSSLPPRAPAPAASRGGPLFLRSAVRPAGSAPRRLARSSARLPSRQQSAWPRAPRWLAATVP